MNPNQVKEMRDIQKVRLFSLGNIIIVIILLLSLNLDIYGQIQDSLARISKVKLNNGKVIEGSIIGNVIIRGDTEKSGDTTINYSSHYYFVPGDIIISIDEQGITLDTLAKNSPVKLLASQIGKEVDENLALEFVFKKIKQGFKKTMIDYLSDGTLVTLFVHKPISNLRYSIIGVFGREEALSKGSNIKLIIQTKEGLKDVPLNKIIKVKK